MISLFEYKNIDSKSSNCFSYHTNSVDVVKFLPNEKQKFLSGSHDRTICVWDIHKNLPISSYLAQEQGVWAISVHPDGKSVMSTGPSPKIYHTDQTTGKCERINWSWNEMCYSLNFINEGSEFIVSGRNGYIELYDFVGFDAKLRCEVSNRIVYACKQIPNSKKFLACTSLGEFLLISEKLVILKTFQITKHEIRCFEFVENDIYTSFENGTLKHFRYSENFENLDFVSEYKAHAIEISTILCIRSKSLLITGAKDSSIFVWNLKTKNLFRNLVGHKYLISDLNANEDERVLVSASWDQTLRSFLVNEFTE